MRIVSFLPSTTEIVCDLGLAEQLRGVTVECNWPANVRNGREIVVGTFADSSMTPGEIDALVRERVAQGLDLYELDDEALRRCDPDLILTQDLCRVCAVASGDVNAALARMNCDAQVLQIDPQRLDDVIASIQLVADAAHVSERGQHYVASLRERLSFIEAEVSSRPRRSVLVLEWIDPPFGAGHWVPDVVERAGGRALLAQPGERSRTLTWDEVRACTPDVVVVAPCGFNLDQAFSQSDEILQLLPATSEVWAIDADAVMVRPGPRLVEGVEALAAVLHGVGEEPGSLVRRVR